MVKAQVVGPVAPATAAAAALVAPAAVFQLAASPAGAGVLAEHMVAVVVPAEAATMSVLEAQFELYGPDLVNLIGNSLVRAWDLHSNKYKITLRI